MRLRYRLVSYAYTNRSQEQLQRMYHDLWHELWRHGGQARGQHSGEWRPPLDIHETPTTVLVKMELAGMREDNIEVALYEDMLIVTGTREDDTPCDNDSVYCEAQVKYGVFRAEVPLLWSVDRESVEALYDNGFLRVSLPKKVESLAVRPGAEPQQRLPLTKDRAPHHAHSASTRGAAAGTAPRREGEYRDR